eukprot:EG_transcript_10805
MPALPAPANIPVASIAPDLDDDPNCVVGTVLLDQHARDLETVHSLFSRRVPITLAGQTHARVSAHIADGTWATVYLVFQEDAKRFAALKVVPVGAANAESYHAEVETLRRLQHPNVVQYYGHFVRRINTVKCLCIELEYCGKQTLGDYIVAKQAMARPMPAPELVAFAAQLAAALQYVHEQGLLHGDLRPENVLVTPENKLKLASFGSPLWIERHGRVPRTITGGDRVYAPPEWADTVPLHRRLQPAETPAPAYDMWSLGCVVTELVTLKQLRQDRRCTAALASNAEMLAGLHAEVATAHEGRFATLCAKLLAVDVKSRLTAAATGAVLRSLTEECTAPRSARHWLCSLRKRSPPDALVAPASA